MYTAVYTLLALLVFTSPAYPQKKVVTIRPSVMPAWIHGIHGHPARDSTRPKIGLVLSGGGARGLAQIGVLRVLERHHIPIDLIVGNSLGSVVGGLYAAGYSTAQLEDIALHTNWSDLLSFSEETKRTDLFVGQKQALQEGYLLIRFEGLEPIIPSSISGGQRLSNFFSYLTLQSLYHPIPTFDDLKVPFRATATDLISGRRILLDRGSLAEAMRASVTVPLLYSPVQKDSLVMVDGGLTSNIPADVARSLGCDIVIVVNSTSSMRSLGQLGLPWEIADQIMTIMMQESNRQQLKLADVVITPESVSRIASDFSRIDTLIGTGERVAEASVPSILGAIDAHTPKTLDGETYHDVILRFEGDPPPDSLRAELAADALHDSLSPSRVRRYLNEAALTGEYSELSAVVREVGSPVEITWHARKNHPIDKIAFSGNALVSSGDVRQALEGLAGTDASPSGIQSAMENVLALYRKKGYSLARVESLRVDRDSGSCSFFINEGRISQIRYEGNEKTRDYIIRREFPLDEGEVFSIDKASQGIVNIKSTGLFDYVLLDVRYSANQPVVFLKVKEKSSELLRLGFHADDEHGLVSTIDVRDANFRGAWEDLGVVLRYGYRDRGLRAEYTINRIFNTYLTFNLRGYVSSRDVFTYQDDPSLTSEHWDRIEQGRYRQTKTGASITFGSNFKRLGDITAELRWEHHTIDALSGAGFTPEQYRYVGLRLQSIIDTEDKFSFPTEGMQLSVAYEAALKSFGSEAQFGKIGVSYESYHTFLPRHTLHPKVTVGFADQTLPLAEQFSLGGFNSFTGLREDDSRGRQIFLVNMEYRFSFPFRLLFETYLKARYDLGTISLVPQELKLNRFRHGIGLEIALDTPIGQASVGMGKSFYFQQDLPNSPLTVGPLLLYFSVGPPL